MNAKKIIQQGIKDNPEVRIVLEIATRARAMEDTNPAVDLTPKNDVVTVPNNLQFALHTQGIS